MRRSTGLIGLPDPALTLPFRARLRGVPCSAVPRIPLEFRGSSSRALRRLFRVPRAEIRPLPCGTDRLPWGFVPHRDVNPQSPPSRAYSQARFVPPATFRTSSTVCSSADLAGLFRPAATSGIRSSGVLPPTPPYELFARRDPRAVAQPRLPPVARRRQLDHVRPKGFARCENPSRGAKV
jgi:hypothetical protein